MCCAAALMAPRCRQVRSALLRRMLERLAWVQNGLLLRVHLLLRVCLCRSSISCSRACCLCAETLLCCALRVSETPGHVPTPLLC